MSGKNLLAAALLCSSFAVIGAALAAEPTTEGKSRAQVLEELKQAQADGSYYCSDSDRLLECNALAVRQQLALQKAPQLGHWLSQSGLLEIDIAACGQSLCGTVIKELGQSTVSPSALGLKVLSGLSPVSAGEWKGRIFNRANGESYDCLMSLASPTQLRILAYKDTPANGKEQIWSRVE
jgi:uncharacterized protein (DUF2147 family)